MREESKMIKISESLHTVDDELDKYLDYTDITDNDMAKIKAVTLEKAMLAEDFAAKTQKRKMKWPMKVCIAAVASCFMIITVFAATNLGETLVELFGDDFLFLARLSLVSDYGAPVGAEATDQGVTVRLEEAYTNDTSALMLLSFKDKYNRLSNDLSLFDLWHKGLYTFGEPLKKDEKSGVFYGLMEFHLSRDVPEFSEEGNHYVIEKLFTRKKLITDIDYGIDIGDYVRYDNTKYQAAQLNSFGDLDIEIDKIPGLLLKDIYCTDEGMMVKAVYNDVTEGIKRDRIGFKLRTPDGQLIDPSSWSAVVITDNNPSIIQCIFENYKNIEDLKGYQLLVGCQEYSGMIQGNWELTFDIPQKDSGKIVDVSQVIEMEGYEYTVDRYMLNKYSIAVDVSVMTEPKEKETEMPTSFGFPHKSYDPRFELYINGEKNDSMIVGSGISITRDKYDNAKGYQHILNYIGKLENAEIRGFNPNTDEELCRIKIK